MARTVHNADIAVGAIIAAAVALAMVPFVVELPLAALVAIWVVSTAGRSIAPVHQHCHAHYAVFGNALADHAYDAVLLLAAGNTTAVWHQQHVRGHHRHYLERTHDPAANQRFGGGRLRFTILGDAMAFVDSLRIAECARDKAALWLQLAMQLGIAVAAFVADPMLALSFVVVPWLLLRWAVFWFSWAQHDGVPMTDVYDGSVTHFGRTNRFYLNVGHHTAHHEKPTLHWTQLPARTAHIVERIPSPCLR
jgi:beta-carotene hydroxylase